MLWVYLNNIYFTQPNAGVRVRPELDYETENQNTTGIPGPEPDLILNLNKHVLKE